MIAEAGQRRRAQVEPAIALVPGVKQHAGEERIHDDSGPIGTIAHDVHRDLLALRAAPQIGEGHDAVRVAQQGAIEVGHVGV